MGFGTFDGIHPGHEFFLRQLKKLGDELIVVVARDSNVERIKGRKPKNDENVRLSALKATHLADKVCLGHLTDFYQPIVDFSPDIIGLGYDQKADVDAILEKFPNIKIIRQKSFSPETYKSSLLNI